MSEVERLKSYLTTVKSIDPAIASLLAVAGGVGLSELLSRDRNKFTQQQLAEIDRILDKRRARKLRKAHAPVPPVQGLVWDEQKDKWVKPENVGKTASEIQGKKRIRGTTTGQAGRTAGGPGTGGKGRGREYGKGRVAKPQSGDIGIAGKTARSKVGQKKRARKKAA